MILLICISLIEINIIKVDGIVGDIKVAGANGLIYLYSIHKRHKFNKIIIDLMFIDQK